MSTKELPRWAVSKMTGGVSEVTLLTPIISGPIPGEARTYEECLREELASVQQRLSLGFPTVIGSISVIHFARWLILRPEQYQRHAAPYASALEPLGRSTETKTSGDEKPRPAPPSQPAADAVTYRSWLLFASNFDGDLKSYLRDFAIFIGPQVDRIWGNCEGYPPGGSRDFERFWNYAKHYQIPTDAFFAAYPELSVARIHQLHVFKQRFDEFVARTRQSDGRSISNVADLLDAFLRENLSYAADFPSPGGIFPDTTDVSTGGG